jgi:tRNA 2-selenouridine synthase
LAFAAALSREGLDLKHENVITVAQIDGFDEIIDVRSPAEFAEDHIPGAVSCPVLDDGQRARVGTMYVQVSSFEAKKVGAALVARNVARHIEERFVSREREWRPLVYCWRGGQRSGAMAEILRQVGWRVSTLKGGYKSYRREVLTQLDELAQRFRFKVVCGATGSGKSRLLEALEREGAQVLDLEGLARHRGSLLGDLPGDPQPSQKMFDSLVWDRLRHLDETRPVFVEAESRKIGGVQVHTALIDRMRAAECVALEAPIGERVQFLKREYGHFLEDPGPLKEKLACLADLHGAEIISHWTRLADTRDWDALVPDLLERHYDPAYRKSTLRNFVLLGAARRVQLEGLDEGSLRRAASELCRDAQAVEG